MADYTDLPNSAVGIGGIPSGTTVTALRDNPIAIAQRSTGAPKIFSVPYNVQVFTASGTWTKPANAETGDIVEVFGVGGGGSGGRNTSGSPSGGSGGAGGRVEFLIENLSATEDVIIGAGGALRTSNANGLAGGDTVFGSQLTPSRLKFQGGPRGLQDGSTPNGTEVRLNSEGDEVVFAAGEGVGGTNDIGSGSRFGGGGGGGALNTSLGGASLVGGHGGKGGPNALNDATAGKFPGGGGGGAVSSDSGAGANGYMVVTCRKQT